ncbi:hypothetical protein B7486_56875, partial [cyanobacterium TDX16]
MPGVRRPRRGVEPERARALGRSGAGPHRSHPRRGARPPAGRRARARLGPLRPARRRRHGAAP